MRPESSPSLPLLDGSCTQGCFSTDLDFLFLFFCSPLLERERFFDSAGLLFFELDVFSLSLDKIFLVSFFSLARSFEEDEDKVDETELLEFEEDELREEVSDTEESDSESLDSDDEESSFLMSPSILLLQLKISLVP